MTDYVSTTPGLYPLPDWAKESLSDLKGHQKHDLISGTESEAVAEQYRDARREVVDAQVEAGLDRIVEGQLRWDDMLAHPLVVADAVETHGLVRYYDNNNFYREPVVVDSLEPTGDVASELEAAVGLTDDDVQAVLPGPYSLASLATDEHYGDPAEFQRAIGSFLAEEASSFPAVETLFLLEPSLVTAPPNDGQRADVIEAINAVATAFSGEVVVHGYWGAYGEATHRALIDSAVDAIGYDLVAAPEACADRIRADGTTDRIALGVIDGQNTRLERPAAVREQLSAFEAQLDATPDRVYVTSNTELFYLPVSKAEAKLQVLADVAAPEVAA